MGLLIFILQKFTSLGHPTNWNEMQIEIYSFEEYTLFEMMIYSVVYMI